MDDVSFLNTFDLIDSKKEREAEALEVLPMNKRTSEKNFPVLVHYLISSSPVHELTV